MQLLPTLTFAGVMLLTSTSFGQTNAPTLGNPGFEDGGTGEATGWKTSGDAALVSVEEGGAHSGNRAAVLRAGETASFITQELPSPGKRPVVVSGYFKAEGLVVDESKTGDLEESAQLYVHVLYKDRPYSDAGHFWVDIPPGTHDWQLLAVEVRPRQDLEPSLMKVSVVGRFSAGAFRADDLSVRPIEPFAGADAATWERADEAVILSDLSVCTPREALADTHTLGHWKLLDYETETFAGRALFTLPDADAPPVTLSPGVAGWHAIYLGLGINAWLEGGNMVRARVTGDPAYQERSSQVGTEPGEWCAKVQEVFLKCADLTERGLQFAQQFQGYGQTGGLLYVKLVPMTDAEVDRVARDARQRATKRLVATIDGQSFIYERRPTTEEELREEFEHYRGTDFGTIWWGIPGPDGVNYDSKLGTIAGSRSTSYPNRGDRYYNEAVHELIRKGIDINQVAVAAAHDVGAKIHITMRPAAWQCVPPWEDYFVSDFYTAHPKWRCVDRDGTPVPRMSFAAPQVREHLLGIFREVLEAEPDGVGILFNRGIPLILWEEPFCAQFIERYGEDARQVAEDDPRIYELRAEMMTSFMQGIRALLDEVREAKGLRRRLELSAMVLQTEEDNRKFGLDVERWVKEGLVDELGVYRVGYDTSGEGIDLAYFKRITQGTNVRVYPCMFAGSPVGMRQEAAGWYDAGADGLAFWDPSGVCRSGVSWPVMSRLGHEDEVREHVVEQTNPSPVTVRLKRLGDFVLGRWQPGAGF